jgi:lysozyme
MHNRWNQAAWDFIDKQEGNVLRAYFDNGSWACGRGIHGPDINQNTIWTAEESDARFKQKLDEIQSTINPGLTIELPQPAFNACMSFSYNLGTDAFLGSTLLKDINAGRMQQAADQFPDWDHAGGKVNENLLARRNQERAMFLSGIGGGQDLPPVQPGPPQTVPVVPGPVPVRVPVVLNVGGNVNPIKKVQASKNATKVLLAIVALLTTVMQDPTAHAFVMGLLVQHPRISSAIAGVAALLALIHDPNPPAQA